MSWGKLHSRNRSTKRILERCQIWRNAEDVIVIDDETDSADVVVTDDPCKPSEQCKIAPECSHNDVIYIDDEEEDNESSSLDSSCSQSGETSSGYSDIDELLVNVGFGNISHDHSGPCRNCGSWETFTRYSDTDECLMNAERGNISSDHVGPFRNCYWVDLDSECSMSESTILEPDEHQGADFDGRGSDCEVVEDFSGDIREVWEKAAIRKKELRHLASNQSTTTSSRASTSNNAEGSPTVNSLSADEDEAIHMKSTVNIQEPVIGKKVNEKNPEKCSQTAKSRDCCVSSLVSDEVSQVKSSACTTENHDESLFSDNEECRTGIPCYAQTMDDNVIYQDKMERQTDEYSFKTCQMPVAEHGTADIENSKTSDSGELSIFSSQQEETFHTNLINEVDALFKTSEVELALQSKPVDINFSYMSVIGERERHKETEDYRRAAKEEWASRELQLKIQAEEAQRLRKKRKAENIRLLEMKSRQKRRLEEIREFQRKDEEATQMKEKIRTEVGKEIQMMETKYKDMASVLRALGIHVNGGNYPNLNEVNCAYKQALLRFHPDRASRSDIRRQVEAEEKFKLISRLKETLLF